MLLTKDNPNIPDWLKTHLNLTCPYCNVPLVDNEELTERKCINRFCPGHMAYKIEALAKRFKIAGVGPATALTYIRHYQLKSHVQMIPIWFDKKPKMNLWEVGEIAMIQGYQKQWRELCKGRSRMAEITGSMSTPAVIRANAAFLNYVESLCEVIPPKKGSVVNIMLSGSIDGYSNRALFVKELNDKYGEYIQLVDVGKRKTDCAYLIKEPYTVDHEKSQIAREYGIQILSPAELVEKLENHVAYINEERSVPDAD